MALPSPECLVNGSPAVPAVAVAASATVTIALANPAGAQYWSISCTSTDETNTAAAINASLSVNMGTKTATFAAPSTYGSAVIFTSTVGVTNVGLDANKVAEPSLTTTFKVNVLVPATGLAVFAAAEELESDPSFGWIVLLNGIIRNSVTAGTPLIYTQTIGGGGGYSYTGPTPVPPFIFLIGTPPSFFDYDMPIGPYTTTIVNTTGHTAIVNPTVGSSWSVLSATADTLQVPYYFDGYGYMFPLVAGQGDVAVQSTASSTPAWALTSIGFVNLSTPGQLYIVPVQGSVLNFLDGPSNGCYPPYLGLGNPSLRPVNTSLQGSSTLGLTASDGTGANYSLAQPVAYPNAAWNTQTVLVGGYGVGSVGAPFGDTITGGTQSIIYLTMPPGSGSGECTTRIDVVIQVRITQSDVTPSLTVGDRVTITQSFDLDYNGGVYQAMFVNSPVITDYGANSSDIASVTFSLVASGSQLVLTTDTSGVSGVGAGVQFDIGGFFPTSLST